MTKMINRRAALKLSATGMFGSFINLPAVSFASATANNSKQAFQPAIAIFDSTYTESLAFANQLNGSNSGSDIVIKDIQGDVAELWYGQLRSQLMSKTSPLIGLTDRRNLFCLEELVRDVGMKVNLRFDHLIHQSGFVEHQLNGSAIHDLGNKAGFGIKMAELGEVIFHESINEVSAQKLTGPYSPLDTTALVSWVIT